MSLQSPNLRAGASLEAQIGTRVKVTRFVKPSNFTGSPTGVITGAIAGRDLIKVRQDCGRESHWHSSWWERDTSETA